MSHLLRLSAYVVFVLAATATLTNAAERPNIVMIMADDLGYSDLGCFGGEIETPNLDQLAADGLRMTQFYNTAKCHSSRICLLTGRYVYHDGSRDLARHVTFAEVLREAGYSTLMSGKWHLSSEPTNRGFDRYFGHLSGATNFFTGDQSFRLDGKPFDDFGPDFYTTDAITDYAIEFVSEANESKPFFTLRRLQRPTLSAAGTPSGRRAVSREVHGWVGCFTAETVCPSASTGDRNRETCPSTSPLRCAALGFADRRRAGLGRFSHGYLRGDGRSNGS